MSAPLNLGAALRNAWWPIGLMAVSVCAGVAGAYGITTTMSPTYEARASVVVAAYTLGDQTAAPTPTAPAGGTAGGTGTARTQPGATARRPVYDPTMSATMVPTVARYAESASLADAIAEAMRLPKDAVAGHLDASFEPGVQIVTLTASAPTAARAAALANQAADTLRRQVAAGGSLSRRGTLYAQPLDRASAPAAPATPRTQLNYVLGGLLGFLVGVGLVAVRRRIDDRLRSSDEIAAELGLLVLASVPKVRRGLVRRGARQAFRRRSVARSMRTAIAALAPLTDPPGRRLLVTSAFQDDGKTLVASLLSLGLAEQRYHVTLLEGQLRHCPLSQHFPGSSDHNLQRLLSVDDGGLVSSSSVTLRVVPAEPTDPEISRALLRSQQFTRIVDTAAGNSDVLVINGPAVLASGDITSLASHADAAVLVVRAGRTRAPDARRAVRVLRRLGIPVAGVIVADAMDDGAGRPQVPASDEFRPAALPGARAQAAYAPAPQEPAPQEPVTQEPVTQDPITHDPITQEPVLQEPVTQALVVTEPASTGDDSDVAEEHEPTEDQTQPIESAVSNGR